MHAAILTFHAVHRGSTYATNDHIALNDALRTLCELRIPVRPVHEIVKALSNPIARWRLPKKFVALTCDDGELGEVAALPGENGVVYPSFREVQQQYLAPQKALGGVPHLTSFVIASEAARLQIRPNGELTHQWWREVAQSELGAIENHSWDHCHADVATIMQRTQTKGTFKGVDTHADADAQIRLAARSINDVTGSQSTSLFAYPYGDTNDYLVREYFPNFRREHGMKAAFTCEPAPTTTNVNRWALPRYVSGWNWKSNDDLRALLRDARLLG
jgi:peptidoglycan/xylan/chitin deacetylase (PgdA/CDA1 family)